MANSDRSDLPARQSSEGSGWDVEGERRTRVRWSLRPATKVTAIIAAGLLAVAVYYLWAPVVMETANGWFPCGTVVAGPEDEFTSNACRNATDVNQSKAVLSAALAVIVGGGGAVLFGVDRITESRRLRRRDDGAVDLSQTFEATDESDGPSRQVAGRRDPVARMQRPRRPTSTGSRSRRHAPRPRRTQDLDEWAEDDWR